MIVHATKTSGRVPVSNAPPATVPRRSDHSSRWHHLAGRCSRPVQRQDLWWGRGRLHGIRTRSSPSQVGGGVVVLRCGRRMRCRRDCCAARRRRTVLVGSDHRDVRGQTVRLSRRAVRFLLAEAIAIGNAAVRSAARAPRSQQPPHRKSCRRLAHSRRSSLRLLVLAHAMETPCLDTSSR